MLTYLLHIFTDHLKHKIVNKIICTAPSVNAHQRYVNQFKSFPTAMIISRGFQDLLIYLVKFFWSLFNSPYIFSVTFLQEQSKENSLISFFIIHRDYSGYNYDTIFSQNLFYLKRTLESRKTKLALTFLYCFGQET